MILVYAAWLVVASAEGAPPDVFPDEVWEEATPASQGVDPAKLEAAAELLARSVGRDAANELVIIKNGRMIWRGEEIDKRHGVWSATKSFTSTVLGLLIEDGKCTLDTRLANVLPEMKEHYPEVTLRHLTTMTSGYRAVGDTTTGSYKHGPSSTPFRPDAMPLFTPPGSQYAYWDSAMNVLGLALTKIAGEPLETLFRRRIADPIGMKEWDWGDYATVDGVVVNGGSGNGSKHVFISAREMARFGLLMLRKGRWSDRQLLSADWIEQATRVQVPATLPWAQPESEIDGRGVYGFNWWVNGIKPNAERKFPGAPEGMFWASGHNNNKCFVIPEWNMVIVRLGLDGRAKDDVWNAFLSAVSAAVSSVSRPVGERMDRNACKTLNYDESKVGDYTVPDPLFGKDGKRITDAASWRASRRKEVLQDFRDLMYGHTPELPLKMQAHVVATRRDAVDGLATRTIVKLHFFDDPQAPHIELMVYLPNKQTGPVPMFLGLSFTGNASIEDDPAIGLPTSWMRPQQGTVAGNRATEALRGSAAASWPVKAAIERGYGVATFYYGDVEPDYIEGWRDGIRGYALKLAARSERGEREWGALGAWAWGLSRAMDYLATMPEVNAGQVVVLGHSRLGKTALWAGAQDERFAIVISNNSGEGGASLARRNFGENIACSIDHASWRYCERFRDYVDRENELPFDQHMLLGLIAPRPVYIASATKDLLADPQGEFLSAVHAEPIYRLFGLRGVDATAWPAPDKPIGQTIGYHLRTGEHAITNYDWQQYLNFADRHFQDPQSPKQPLP
jgi:CubicO group peptidase (beta-lactamase class C family)